MRPVFSIMRIITFLFFLTYLQPMGYSSKSNLEYQDFELNFEKFYWLQNYDNSNGIQVGLLGFKHQFIKSPLNPFFLAYKQEKEHRLKISPATLIEWKKFKMNAKFQFSLFSFFSNFDYDLKKQSLFTFCQSSMFAKFHCFAGLRIKRNRFHWPAIGLSTDKRKLLSYTYNSNNIHFGIEVIFKLNKYINQLNFKISFKPYYRSPAITHVIIDHSKKIRPVPSMSLLMRWGVSLNGAIQLQKHRNICLLKSSDQIILQGKNWKC